MCNCSLFTIDVYYMKIYSYDTDIFTLVSLKANKKSVKLNHQFVILGKATNN